MNKKFKIVSSIALAGMLLTSSLGMNKVNAADVEVKDEFTTNPVAVYKKLVEGKTVVPFVLANKNDVLTVKDVVESEIFKGKVSAINGVAVSSLNVAVGTGDRVTTTDGTDYTIIVYGDVDGNGRINASDALAVEKYTVDMEELSDVQKEAADIGANDGKINSADSLRIKEYNVDIKTTVIDNLPPKEEVVENSNYSMTLNDGGYINNVNVNKNTLAVKLTKTLDKEAKLKLVVSDTNKDTADKEMDLTIRAHTDYVEFSNIDLSSLAEGTITGNLYEGDKIVASFEIVKNTTMPMATNIRTDRVSTRQATLSLEGMGTNKVTKIKYLVLGKDKAAPKNKEDLTGSADVQNNVLTDLVVSETLQTNEVYKVYFYVENEFGSQSEIKSAVIAKDTSDVYTEAKLDAVNVPNLADLTEDPDANFTFVKNENDKNSHTYVATLYKNGVAVAEKETTDEKVSFKAEMTTEGTYKVSVVAKGNDEGTTETSEPTVSGEVTVSTLKAVEGLKLATDDEGNVVLSWSNPNGKDDFDSYAISLYTVDAEGKVTLAKTGIACDNEDNSVILTGDINANSIYVAKVGLVAKTNQMATINSKVVTSNQFYKVATPNMDTTKLGSTSIKFTVTPIEIPNKEVTYKVEVYNVVNDVSNPNFDPTKPAYTYASTKNVTIDENNQVTVDGLNPLTDYAFRLVAVVDGNEVQSGYTAPITTLPTFNKVEVSTVAEAEKENSNKVALDGNTIVMNGARFDTTVIDELVPAKNVISALEVGDVVTINDEATAIDIVLGGRADNRTFDTGTLFQNSTVKVESNAFTKTLIGTFKSLTLSGTNSIFKVDGVTTSNDIVLTNGVEVTSDASKEYKVEAGAKVIINDIGLTTSKDLTLTANDDKNLVIDANTVENNLVFENTTGGDANITFMGTPDNTSEQRGTITIKSTNGVVKVDTPNVNVSADMKVEVTNGEVNIQDPSLTGDKTVTVSASEGKTSVVKAVAKTKAPVAIDNKELKDYSDDEIKELFPEINDSQEKVIAIREYINSFGLNGTGATIKVDANSDQVTITLPGEAQNVTIGNLK